MLRTFREAVAEHCQDQVFEALAQYVIQNPSRFNGKSNFAAFPDDANLDSIDIKSVQVTEMDGKQLSFIIIVEAEIEVSQRKSHGDLAEDGVSEWYDIFCNCVLDDEFKDLHFKDITEHVKLSSPNIVSEYLVPIISKDELDGYAEQFLQFYYPDALQTPMALPIREVVHNIGLDIKEVSLSKNCTIFGQIYFSEATTSCYDESTFQYYPLTVQAGTILVDPDVFFMRTLGSLNNTIIHECVHWVLHYGFFELEKMYLEDIHRISCSVEEEHNPTMKNDPYAWMEWQANAIAPRILMPAQTFRQQVDAALAHYQKNNTEYEAIEATINEMADFFQVSKLAAKIRMIDLGYTEAIGIGNYIDGHYVPNHSFDRRAIQERQTFTISVQDALPEYVLNLEFRSLIDSGRYIYVDSCYCINAPQYVTIDASGMASLTGYAREHMEECCLVFNVKATKNTSYGIENYHKCVLCRDILSELKYEVTYAGAESNKKITDRAALLAEAADDLSQIMRNMPNEFSDAFLWLMDSKPITEEKLAEESLVSVKTIQRIRTTPDYKVSLETVMALCIGMRLPPFISEKLIEKAGFTLKYSGEQGIYRMLLYNQSCNIFECNEILKAQGYKPLGKEN